MSKKNAVAITIAMAVLMMLTTAAAAQDTCKPFGGTIFAWHDGKAWAGEGDFVVGREVLHAKITDVNTGLENTRKPGGERKRRRSTSATETRSIF